MRLRRVVNPQLHRDDDVVLHASHFAAERRPRLSKHVLCLLELEGVHGELLVEAAGVAVRVFGEQGLQDVDALLAEHGVGERAHAVLDFLCGEDAVVLGGVVDAVAGVRDVAEGALVVLGLEAEVALAHDDDRGELELVHGADALDVPLDQGELLAGLCAYRKVSKCACVVGIKELHLYLYIPRACRCL